KMRADFPVQQFGFPEDLLPVFRSQPRIGVLAGNAVMRKLHRLLARMGGVTDGIGGKWRHWRLRDSGYSCMAYEQIRRRGFKSRRSDFSLCSHFMERSHAGMMSEIRKEPSSAWQKQAAYPNGTILQMTGRCAGGAGLFALAG